MSAPRSSIFLGDVVAAIRVLEPAGEDADEIRSLIAALLGFEPHRTGPGPNVAPGAPPPTPPTIRGVSGPSATPPGAKPPAAPEPAALAPTPATWWLPSTLKTQTRDALRDHEPADDAATQIAGFLPLDPAPPAGFDSTEREVADPLFEPAWSRAIFGALLATWREGEVDVGALVEKVASREHLERLPTRPLATLRRGAQVLVDTGTGMTPFIADQAWALDEIERVVGRDLVQVLSFPGRPETGGTADEPQPYLPPLPGTPVILLSDLGIARPDGASDRASVDEWKAFARRVRCAGCPLIALLPYARARWPRGLRRLVTMIHWDPRTTVGRLRAIIGRAHHVR